jgi:hypothetical protein
MINLYNFFNKPEKLDMFEAYYQPIQCLSSQEEHEELTNKILHIIKKVPHYAFARAKYVIKYRWIEAEPHLRKSDGWWRTYKRVFDF